MKRREGLKQRKGKQWQEDRKGGPEEAQRRAIDNFGFTETNARESQWIANALGLSFLFMALLKYSL